MKAPKKRTKKYQPREIQLDPVSWAVAGVHNFDFAKIDEIFEPINAAMLLLKKGEAKREDWNRMRQAFNIAQEFPKEGVGRNLLPQIHSGLEALEAIANRMVARHGPTACYATELAAIDEAIRMFHAQMSACTQAEFHRAVRRAKGLITSGTMDNVARLYEQMKCAESAYA